MINLKTILQILFYLVIESLYHDKKTMDHKIRFILVKEIGSVEIVDHMPEAEILKVL